MVLIFIHGAWHDSRCWLSLLKYIKQENISVLTPNLAGHAQDQTDFRSITLKTYINDLTTLINQQSQPVVLLGHSMAGVIISQLAENMADKISHCIYLSAFIPRNQCSLMDIATQSNTTGIATEMIIDHDNKIIDLKRSQRVIDLFYNKCSALEQQQALMQIQAEPLQPFFDKVYLSPKNFGRVKKSYIECTDDHALPLKDQRRMQRNTDCERYTINADHSPFLSSPKILAETLLHITAR